MFKFWKRKEKIEPRIYIHLCSSCRIETELNKKLDHCPKCAKSIDEPYEYINLLKGPGWIYHYSCKTCRVRFDTRAEDSNTPCPLCKKPSESDGYLIACGSHQHRSRLKVLLFFYYCACVYYGFFTLGRKLYDLSKKKLTNPYKLKY